MQYKNRDEAARLLVEQLANFKGENPLVLAIPRGAVPMAKLIANGLSKEAESGEKSTENRHETKENGPEYGAEYDFYSDIGIHAFLTASGSGLIYRQHRKRGADIR